MSSNLITRQGTGRQGNSDDNPRGGESDTVIRQGTGRQGNSDDNPRGGESDTVIRQGTGRQGNGNENPRGGDSITDVQYQEQRGLADTDLSHVFDTSGSSANFDVNKLKNDIESLYGLLFGSGNNAVDLGTNVKSILESLSNAFKSSDALDLSRNEATNMAESVFNTLSSYVASRLDNLYNRENWVFQNEYNNPLNQMRRLMEAGINPAFYYGCLGKSDSGEIAQSQTQAGQMQTELDPMNYKLRNAIQGVQMGLGVAQTGLSLASGVADIGGFTNSMAQASKTSQEAALVFPDFARTSQWGDMNAYAGMMNAQANQQNAETNEYSSRIDAAFKDVQAQNYDDQIKLGYENLANAYAIAQIGANANIQSAQIGANANIQSARIGANANIQSARINADSQQQIAKWEMSNSRWLQRQGFKNDISLKTADAYLNIIPTLYRSTEHTESKLVNHKTGQEHSLRVNADGSLQSGIPSIAEWKAGMTLEGQDKWLSEHSEFERVSTTVKSSELDFERLAHLEGIAQRVSNGLINGNLSASDGLRLNQRIKWGRTSLWKDIMKKVGNAFAGYTFQQNEVPLPNSYDIEVE